MVKNIGLKVSNIDCVLVIFLGAYTDVINVLDNVCVLRN
ncbi:hypothetical protein PLUTE_a0667 [Pseudoalteromonas luteoviolacea DSM 6061]|nr:hypothetical protein [Pseudoalteromonas luteoviolacea DSM 6061]